MILLGGLLAPPARAGAPAADRPTTSRVSQANRSTKQEIKLTPLEKAINARDCDKVVKLIQGGADVRAKERSPFTEALAIDEPKIARLILDAGADVNAVDECGSHPLYYAASFADADMLGLVERLVDKGAEVRSRNIGSATPLHAACDGHGAKIEIVDYLLAHGATATAADDDGNTPLHYLAGSGGAGGVKVAEALVANGAKISVKNKDGETALDLARRETNTALSTFLEKQR
jgi:ankyrin repeat protein